MSHEWTGRLATLLPFPASLPPRRGTSATIEGSAAGHRAWMALLVVLAFCALTALVARLDGPLALAVVLALGAGVATLIRPELATLAVVFLLYSNVPAVSFRLYGMPQWIAGAFILLLGIPLVHQAVIRRGGIRTDRTFLLMLAFLAVLLAASLGAKDKEVAFGRTISFAIEGLVIYWLVINTVRGLSVLKRVIWAALAAGVLLSGLAIFQSVTGSYDQQFGGLAERQLAYEYKREAGLRRGEEFSYHRADRAGGPQLGPNRFGQVMIVLLPLAFFLYRRERTMPARFSAVAAGGLIVIGGVLLTYSRATLVVLVLLIAAAAVVRWISARTLGAGAICVVLSLPVVAPGLVYRISTLSGVTTLDDPSAADGSLRGRATEMLAALHAFVDHPILGVGPGQYLPFYSMRYQQISDIAFRQLDENRRAHTLYFEMAAETGILGLSIFLAIPLLMMHQLWRSRRMWADRDPELSDLATGLGLSIFAFLATAFFLSHAFERYYWFLLALAGAAHAVMRSRGGKACLATGRPHWIGSERVASLQGGNR